LSGLQKLFTESTARFVVTAAPQQAEAWEALLPRDLPWQRIGTVIKSKHLQVSNEGKVVLDLSLAALSRAFARRFGGLI
jgi:phosphoribosylformylglycinamidine (FGAM) synthase-like enzyme